MALTLYGTPLSHFTRKVRVVLLELAIPFEWRLVPHLVNEQTPAAYGNNPLLRVPTLVDADADGERFIIESDHIVRYLVAHHAREDVLGVHTNDADELNRLAVVNGCMAHEVTMILAKRGGMVDGAGGAYFDKLPRSIESGLAFLNASLATTTDALRYVDVATVCLWDHVVHYGMIPDLGRFANIASLAARLSTRPAFATTAPS